MNRRERDAFFVILSCCMACLGRASAAMAGDDRDGRDETKPRVASLLGNPNWGKTFSGPLCGVYAACTAIKLIGMEADPRKFLTSKYVGNTKGSSPEEVSQVVKDAGARADILSGLSAFDLRLIDCPLIANVRTSPKTPRFDHWVVVIPTTTGMMIYDGVKKPYNVHTSEFLGIWNGIGICLTRDGPTPLLFIWVGRILVLVTIVLFLFFSLRGRGFLAWVGRSSNHQQVFGLFFASLILFVPGNLLFGDLLHHGKGVKVATASSEAANYRIGTLDDVKKASASSDMLLVDARREQDYRLGTIEGAVNIPVTASHWEIEDFVKELPRDTPIVVFCQSASCQFDETIASELTSLGFHNLRVCREGWAEFQKLQASDGH